MKNNGRVGAGKGDVKRGTSQQAREETVSSICQSLMPNALEMSRRTGGNVSEEATKHPWPGPWHSFPCCLDRGTVSSCIYLFGVKNMAGCLIVVLFFCLT